MKNNRTICIIGFTLPVYIGRIRWAHIRVYFHFAEPQCRIKSFRGRILQKLIAAETTTELDYASSTCQFSRNENHLISFYGPKLDFFGRKRNERKHLRTHILIPTRGNIYLLYHAQGNINTRYSKPIDSRSIDTILKKTVQESSTFTMLSIRNRIFIIVFLFSINNDFTFYSRMSI
jgi:hypothetical protein